MEGMLDSYNMIMNKSNFAKIYQIPMCTNHNSLHIDYGMNPMCNAQYCTFSEFVANSFLNETVSSEKRRKQTHSYILL